MYNKHFPRRLVAAKLSHREHSQSPGLASPPVLCLTCEATISAPASAQQLQSSRRPEWLAIDHWNMESFMRPEALGYTARGFVAVRLHAREACCTTVLLQPGRKELGGE